MGPILFKNGMPKVKHFVTRNFSTKRLTPTVTFMSNESTKHLRSCPDISEFSSDGKPLAVMLCWLASKNNAINKYAKFYLDQGFDVLALRMTLTQVLLPNLGVSALREEMIPTLLTSNHEKKLIHGFSVGGYAFGQMLKLMHNDPTGQCQELMKTMNTQIWDSVVDRQLIAPGVSQSLASPLVRKLLKSYCDFHLKTFERATKYYIEAEDYFFNKPLIAPALFFTSAKDELSTIEFNESIQNKWIQNQGIECTSKFWKNSQHVGHMRMYPEEYMVTIKMFLDKCGFEERAKISRIPGFAYESHVST